jgi:hypothetical protein
MKVSQNPQFNRHEIMLVLDKLQTLVSLGAHCLDADEYDSHSQIRIPSIPFKPRVCLTPPFALTFAVVCASCASAFYFFRRKVPYPSL